MNPKTINLDCEIGYFWYDHFILRENGDVEIVQRAIEEGDYDTFMEMYNKYEHQEKYNFWHFFPDEASLLVNDTVIGYIYITKPEGFKLITFNEYECG